MQAWQWGRSHRPVKERRGLRRTFGLMLQEAVAFADQPSHVALQDQAVHSSTDGTERRRELDEIHHHGHQAIVRESMLVPETSERSANLLVDEVVGRFHRDDLARHREWNTEVSGSPCDLLAETDQAARDTGNSPLSRLRHRVEVNVDASRQIENTL